MTKIARVDLPLQSVPLQMPDGTIDPVWYEKLQQLAKFVNLFSEVDPQTMTNGQVLIWNTTASPPFPRNKFYPGAN